MGLRSNIRKKKNLYPNVLLQLAVEIVTILKGRFAFSKSILTNQKAAYRKIP